MTEKTKGRVILVCIYLLAFGIGYWSGTLLNCSGTLLNEYNILLKSAVAVAVAVAVIFAGSVLFNNSSMFDPYWSLAPPLMVLCYVALVMSPQTYDIRPTINGPWQALQSRLDAGNKLIHYSPRIILLFLCTFAYSVRLTWNFLRGWPGLKHEDWRYTDFRANTGKAYWLVSLSGIHLFPALMVFGGTLSIWVTVVQVVIPLNFLDLAAIVVTGAAILLEALADRQLRLFVSQNKETGITMKHGLWAVSRHPNYLGEILFWWGLYFFALAANSTCWWVFIGPLAITLMFIFASIPMIEKRLMKRRKDYAAYREKVSMLLPWKFLINREND